MARRKARRAANSTEQRMERSWTGHRRDWLRVATGARKMPLRLSGRAGDPSPSRGSSGALLGSDNAPAENSARKSRATGSHPSSSSTSPSPQLSPRLKSEYTDRVTGPGVTWRRRREATDLALSTNDMAGKTERTAKVERPPPRRPAPITANQRRPSADSTNKRRVLGVPGRQLTAARLSFRVLGGMQRLACAALSGPVVCTFITEAPLLSICQSLSPSVVLSPPLQAPASYGARSHTSARRA